MDRMFECFNGASRLLPTRWSAVQAGGQCTPIRRASVKSPMGWLLVLEREIARYALAHGGYGLIGIQTHFFIFEAPSQPFDEHVIPPAPASIHTERP